MARLRRFIRRLGLPSKRQPRLAPLPALDQPPRLDRLFSRPLCKPHLFDRPRLLHPPRLLLPPVRLCQVGHLRSRQRRLPSRREQGRLRRLLPPPHLPPPYPLRAPHRPLPSRPLRHHRQPLRAKAKTFCRTRAYDLSRAWNNTWPLRVPITFPTCISRRVIPPMVGASGEWSFLSVPC